MSQFLQDLNACDRRRALGFVGGALGFGISACTGDRAPEGAKRGGPPPGEMAPIRSYPDVTATGADGATCVAFPGETEGPFPADGRGRASVVNVLGGNALQRADMRSSFADYSGSAEGVPLELTLTLVDADNACAPLGGRPVYVWHCDAAGRYSLYDLPEQNYLRGMQVTDADGRVRFMTIFPGCYAGRFPHIHFEVFDSVARASSGREARLTSQIAVPAEAGRQVYARPEYQGSTANLARVSLERDNVFSDNTPAQVQAQTLRLTGAANAGHRGAATVGLTASY